MKTLHKEIIRLHNGVIEDAKRLRAKNPRRFKQLIQETEQFFNRMATYEIAPQQFKALAAVLRMEP